MAQGAVHDFQLFKTTLGKLTIPEWVCLVVDSGYQGIQKYHANSIVPHKKPRGEQLTVKEKTYNHTLARFRMKI